MNFCKYQFDKQALREDYRGVNFFVKTPDLLGLAPFSAIPTDIKLLYTDTMKSFSSVKGGIHLMPGYHALSEAQAIEYARSIPDLFSKNSELVCREIGDGNLNLVFHISEPASGKSIILKQALPYAKVVGESWPLTLDRARIESEALIIQGKLCPDLVPHVYAYEPDLALTVMQDLSDHVIMRKGLMDGNRYPLFAGHIATFLAHTLFFTRPISG